MNTNPTEIQTVSVPDGSIRDYVDGKARKGYTGRICPPDN